MVTRKKDFEALIVRYLEGQASPEEAMLLEDAKRSDLEVQQMYDHYEKLLHGERTFKRPDSKKAMDQIYSEIQPRIRNFKLKRMLSWTAAAAAILVAVFILPEQFSDYSKKNGMAFIPKGESASDQQDNILYAKNNVREFTLTDNSIVSLAKGSSLELIETFSTNERRSKLNGSGRFTVVHDEEHPFIIEVEGLEVYDIGTVFDIKTDEDTVKIVVHEGAVELRLNNEVLAMQEGDSAFYVISEQLMEYYGEEETRKDTIFTFEGTRLTEVAQVLANFFNKEIIIVSETIKDCPLSVEFKNKSLVEILDIIELILEIKIVRTPSKIEFYGEGCQ